MLMDTNGDTILKRLTPLLLAYTQKKLKVVKYDLLCGKVNMGLISSK